jgi:cytoskeletal protein CcmA (bactofilin family)
LRGDCVVNGNVQAGKLQVEPTAIFNGQCHMGNDKNNLNVAGLAKNTNGIKATVEQ